LPLIVNTGVVRPGPVPDGGLPPAKLSACVTRPKSRTALGNYGTLPQLVHKTYVPTPPTADTSDAPGLAARSNPNPVTTPKDVFVTLNTNCELLRETIVRVAVAFGLLLPTTRKLSALAVATAPRVIEANIASETAILRKEINWCISKLLLPVLKD